MLLFVILVIFFEIRMHLHVIYPNLSQIMLPTDKQFLELIVVSSCLSFNRYCSFLFQLLFNSKATAAAELVKV